MRFDSSKRLLLSHCSLFIILWKVFLLLSQCGLSGVTFYSHIEITFVLLAKFAVPLDQGGLVNIHIII